MTAGKCAADGDLQITRTEAFYPLQELFHRNGLEIDLSQTQPPETLLACWEGRDSQGARVGAVKLELRAGEYVIGGIAVEEPWRRTKVGGRLLETALEECAHRGARQVVLVAKVPAFFKTFGFYPVSMEDYRAVTKCHACLQRGVSCHPEMLRLDLPGM